MSIKQKDDFVRKSDLVIFGKKLKNELKTEITAEILRGTKVLLEQMDKKWNLVAEQYLGINNRLDIVARELSTVKDDVFIIKQDLRSSIAR